MDKRIQLINAVDDFKDLGENWNGLGACVPLRRVRDNAILFLSNCPSLFLKHLTYESIIPNPHGTITIEWRFDKDIVSIEFGVTNANYYSQIGNKRTTEDGLLKIFNFMSHKLFIA